MFHPQQPHPPFPKESAYTIEIQKMLDYNASIIHLIIDCQMKGKSENLPQYMAQLHSNLMWLTKQASMNYHMDHGPPPTPHYPPNPGMSKSHPMHPPPQGPIPAPQTSIPTQPGMSQNSVSFTPSQTPHLSQSLSSGSGIHSSGTWDRPTSPSPIPAGHNPFDFSQWNNSDVYSQRARPPSYMPPQESPMFPNQLRGVHTSPMDNMSAQQRQLHSNMYRSFGPAGYPNSAQPLTSQPRHNTPGANTSLPSLPSYPTNTMGPSALPQMGMPTRMNSHFH